MKNLNLIAEELFNKIRGRFPSVTIGDIKGAVTNIPQDARFFDFDYKEGSTNLGRVSISLDENSVQVMYTDNFVAEEDELTKENWYNFLKELRVFSKKRLLNFDTRNINKSNLDKRDYKFLAANRSGDEQMTESKLYGTSKTSYQDVGSARLCVKHNKAVNQELPAGRTQNIGSIYIESNEGERFKYPYKHLNGARAMAVHVSEGGNPYDDFGQHIVNLSEEMSKLRKFKNYMNRSSVMAEGLNEYADIINDRIEEVKSTILSYQKSSVYKEAIQGYERSILEEVPNEIADSWIEQLTIKQFNEELKDVFPYIYKLIGEGKKAKTLTAEAFLEDHTETYTVQPGDTLYSIAKEMVKYEMQGMEINDAVKMIADDNGIKDPAMIKPGMELTIPWITGAVGGDPITGEPITRGLPHSAYEAEIDDAFEGMMGQFSDKVEEETKEKKICKDCGDEYGKPTTDCPHDCNDPNGSHWKKEKVEESKKDVPVTEFILSLFDRETGQFPKGETAVLTAVEKDYGEQYINPAKEFIEAINAKFEEFNGYKDSELMDGGYDDDDYGPNYQDELDDKILQITPSSKSRYKSKRKVDTKAPVIDPEDMFDESMLDIKKLAGLEK